MKITGLMAWAVTLGLLQVFVAVDLFGCGATVPGLCAVLGVLACGFVFTVEVMDQSNGSRP